MTSLADLPEIIGFFSYSREDDEDSQGALSALRDRIQRELRGQLGRSMKTFRLWQDKEAIAAGKLWEDEIKNAVGQAVFFIPIITPTVIKSPYCKFELESFLAREAELGRNDLVFPILYITVPELEDGASQKNDPVLSIIARRQYLDWREFRHRDVHSSDVLTVVERFSATIRDSLRRSWLSPEERKNQDEAQARRREEETRQAATAAQALEREENERLGREAHAARERAEQEHQQSEAEAKRRAESETHAQLRPVALRWAWLSSTRLAVIGSLVVVVLGIALSPKSPTPLPTPSGQLAPAPAVPPVRAPASTTAPPAQVPAPATAPPVRAPASTTAPPVQAPAPTPVQPAPGAAQQSPAVGGWVGVRIQTVTADIADSLGINPPHGAIVAGVDSSGPAKLGGVEIGDVIVRFDGQDIKDMRDLPRVVTATPVGKTVDVVVIRKGKEQSLQVKVGRPVAGDNAPAPSNNNNNAAPAQKAVVQKVLGFELSSLSDDLRSKFMITPGARGVIVTAVDPDVASSDAGKRLVPGDLIIEVQSAAVSSPAAVQAQIDQLKALGKKVALLLVASANGGTQLAGPHYVALSLEPPTNGKK
jgi:membrane-associated protease RseP (regulator of RpoE activity)